MKSRTLSKKDRKEINTTVQKMYDISIIEDSSIIRLVESEEGDIITCEGEATFLIRGNKYIPVLPYLLRNTVFTKKITIDMGGVKPISGGADVMVPGIVSCDDVKKGDIVSVVDEKHGKPLSVVKVVMDKEDIATAKNGVAAECLHHIGDDVWSITKTL